MKYTYIAIIILCAIVVAVILKKKFCKCNEATKTKSVKPSVSAVLPSAGRYAKNLINVE